MTVTEPQIVAHCLWEMTFHGFEQSQIQAERDELRRRIPWEQVMKDMENKGREEAG